MICMIVGVTTKSMVMVYTITSIKGSDMLVSNLFWALRLIIWKFIGEWQNGFHHGLGEIFYADKSIFKGRIL